MLPTSYVYLHRDPQTGEVRYVGAGSKGRAWACGWSARGGPRRGNRTKEHQRWLQNLFAAGYTMANIVVIVKQGLPRSGALGIEKKEIEKHSSLSLFNRPYGQHSLKLGAIQVIHSQRLREQGKSYADIASVVGVSAMTIYRALNNQTQGYSNYVTY